MYGRLIWVGQERDAEDQEDPPDGRVGQDAAHGAEGEVDDAAGRARPPGRTSLRAERDEQRGPDRQRGRQPEDRRTATSRTRR